MIYPRNEYSISESKTKNNNNRTSSDRSARATPKAPKKIQREASPTDSITDLTPPEFDLAADLRELECGSKYSHNSKISLRITKRNAKKCVTSIVGLQGDSESLKTICKDLKRKLHCQGSITNDEEFGTVIDLTGDQRSGIVQYLVDTGICKIDSFIY